MELAAAMHAKGYREIFPRLLAGDSAIRELPCVQGKTAVPEPAAEGALPAAPESLTLPAELKWPRSQLKLAPQLCHFFEVAFVAIHANGTMTAYSPMRLWTLEARTKAGFTATQTTLFGQLCKAYVYVRTVEQGQQELGKSTALETLKKDSSKHLTRDANKDYWERGKKYYSANRVV